MSHRVSLKGSVYRRNGTTSYVAWRKKDEPPVLPSGSEVLPNLDGFTVEGWGFDGCYQKVREVCLANGQAVPSNLKVR